MSHSRTNLSCQRYSHTTAAPVSRKTWSWKVRWEGAQRRRRTERASSHIS